MGIRLSVVLLVTATLAAASCRRAPTGPVELVVQGRTGAHVTLAADGDRVAAVWAATDTSRVTDIYLATSDDAGRTFTSPVRVNDIDGDVSAGGEQPPRVILKGSAVDVVWVSKRAGLAGIRAATSTDGGRSFAPARSITPAGVTGARGWESATIDADGVVHAVWLDGRNHVPPSPSSDGRASARQAPAPSPAAAPKGAAPAGQPAPAPKGAVPAGQHQHDGAPMRQDIYHAMWKGDGAPIETAVAANVCFCCKTAIVSRGADVFVAWRHLFPGGVRDIAIARSSDGGRTFQEPVRVSADNWQIDACPDDGPAMTVDAGGVLRVTWPTVDTGRRVIFEATSRDGGATFSPRTRVDTAEGGAAHPRIATGPAGRSAVVWDELAQGSRRVVFRLTGEGSPAVLSTGRIASYPAIAAAGDGFVVAWTDQSDQQSTIRALRVQ